MTERGARGINSPPPSFRSWFHVLREISLRCRNESIIATEKILVKFLPFDDKFQRFRWKTVPRQPRTFPRLYFNRVVGEGFFDRLPAVHLLFISYLFYKIVSQSGTEIDFKKIFCSNLYIWQKKISVFVEFFYLEKSVVHTVGNSFWIVFRGTDISESDKSPIETSYFRTFN